MAILGKSARSIATYFEGKWHDENLPIIRAADHVAWLASQVFDGARYFDGVTPDLDLHCARLIESARIMGMSPNFEAGEIEAIARQGIQQFSPDLDLYIRPMMWTTDGGSGTIDVNPEATSFAVCIEEIPMPEAGNYSLTVAPYRRPRQDMAITAAKTGSLYPNNGRIMSYARQRGFSNALSLDIDGNVAETASTNVFAVKDGVVRTPIPNGSFLNGLTRQRVIKLLKGDGYEVLEEKMLVEDFAMADEIFITANLPKVLPVTRFEQRSLEIGPVASRARSLYIDYAMSGN